MRNDHPERRPPHPDDRTDRDDGPQDRSWHRRHEYGQYGRYGNYGGSQDQWAGGLNDGDHMRRDPRHGVLPKARHGAAHKSPDYRADFDSEPYRIERMYGYDDHGRHAALDPAGPQSASNPYEQGRHDRAGAGLNDQFGGEGRMLPGGPAAWASGPRTLPKGYQRSDERLHEDVCERLSRTPGIDVRDVSVHVADGVVTLEGTVPARGMKHAIEDVADDCVGVKDVENRIKVRRVQAEPDNSGLADTADEYRVLNGRKT